jgi:hypothetical protein
MEMQGNTGSEEVENSEQQSVAPPGFPGDSDGRTYSTVGGNEMSKDSNSYGKADYCYFQPFQFTHLIAFFVFFLSSPVCC